jgi:UDP-N-acetylglucosamine 2-epimerase
MKNCGIMMTNSGGYKKRQSHYAYWKPVLVMHFFTERPVAVGAGFAHVVGTEKGNTRRDANEIETERTLRRMPHHGEGMAAEKMARIIKKR